MVERQNTAFSSSKLEVSELWTSSGTKTVMGGMDYKMMYIGLFSGMSDFCMEWGTAD